MDRESVENPLCGQETVITGNRFYWIVWLQRLLLVLVLMGCGLYAGLFLYHGVRLVLYPYDMDNSEAYLVYQGQRLSEGHFLYPPLTENLPYLIDNYPPVYPSLIALGFLFTEPNFHWPRAISFASTCATALILALWTLSRSRNRTAALLTGLIYLSFYHVYDWGALARVDALGVMLAVLGVYFFDRCQSWKIALPFFILALFTRQTLFAAPLSVFCAMFFSSQRKDSFRFLLLLILCGVVGFIALLVLSSGQAWNHLIRYNANQFRLSDLRYYFLFWIIYYTIWGIIPLFILFRDRKTALDRSDVSGGLLFWFICFAIGEALLCGKIGSAPNYLLTLVAATSVCCGVFYSYLIDRNKHCSYEYSPKSREGESREGESREGEAREGEAREGEAREGESPDEPISTSTGSAGASPFLKNRTINCNGIPGMNAALIVFLIACLWQLAGTYHWPYKYDFSPTPDSQDTTSGRWLDEKELRGIKGPVLSDRAGVALMAGHPPVFDPFILTQLSHQGLWDQSVLLGRIAKKEFPLVVLHFDLFRQWDLERFTHEMIRTLREHYQFVKQIQGKYFLYKPIED